MYRTCEGPEVGGSSLLAVSSAHASGKPASQEDRETGRVEMETVACAAGMGMGTAEETRQRETWATLWPNEGQHGKNLASALCIMLGSEPAMWLSLSFFLSSQLWSLVTAGGKRSEGAAMQ